MKPARMHFVVRWVSARGRSTGCAGSWPTPADLTARGDTDGGTWLARPRFRHAVAALCEDSELYALVNGLAEVTSADDARSRTRVAGNVDDPGDDQQEGN